MGLHHLLLLQQKNFNCASLQFTLAGKKKKMTNSTKRTHCFVHIFNSCKILQDIQKVAQHGYEFLKKITHKKEQINKLNTLTLH